MDGEPDHRIADGRKFALAVKLRLCWVCGQPLGRFGAFVLGPMCALNRTSAEPPTHRDCGIYSARNCPFLSRPHARRRGDTLELGAKAAPGFALLRNPGVAAVWVTPSWSIYKATQGGPGPLHSFGDASEITWWCEGRAATRVEVLASVEGGLPALRECAAEQDRLEPGAGAVAFLEEQIAAAERLWPVA